ncbi:MAG TPA: hypothetical protein VN745_10045 [Verrucomicrobiae bacterium]|nr:hypothetical protein [Verrucomicrobiae bacterium]
MTDSALKELLSVPALGALPHLELLHYLLSKDGGKHVAHCLDLDLVATGSSRDDAGVKLDALVKTHIELSLATGQIGNLQTRAPQPYWIRFHNGKRVTLHPATIHIQIPDSVQIVPLPESKLRILAHAA